MGRETSMRNILLAVGLSTWVAGVLDLGVMLLRATAARTPLAPVLASAGQGLVGTPANGEPWTAALLGVGAHFLLVAMIAGVFVLAMHKISAVRAHPWAYGAVYGVAVYFVAPLHGEDVVGLWATLAEIAVHVLCVGLPIGLVAGRLLRPPLAHKAPA